ELPLFVSIFLRLTDFDNENPSPPMTEGKGTEDQAYETVAPEIPPPRKYACHRSCVRIKHRGGGFCYGTPFEQKLCRRVNDGADANAPPKTNLEQSMTQSFEILTENVATMEVQDTHSAESARSGKSTSSPSMVGSPEGIYQPGWGVTNSCCLDTPDAFQDVVDHIVAMGSQLRLRFEQEVRLLKKARAQIARRGQRIQVREEEIKKLDQKV
nr:hypothetical protein [Tanacetum cinerariifolium]